MKLISIPCLLKGGTEFQTLHLVRALVNSNQSLSVVCYHEYDSDMVKMFEEAGANVILLNWKRTLGSSAFITSFAKFLRKQKPDVLHVQYMAPGALPIVAGLLAGVPRIIATVHQPYTPAHGWKAKIILRIVSRFCSPFLAVSKNAQKSWFGTASFIDSERPVTVQERVLTLYNTIPVSKIKELALKENLIDKPTKVSGSNSGQIIGTVSRLRHEKGIDVLLKAFATVNESFSDTQLLLVGDGPDRTKYEELANELGIRNKVTFYGEANWEAAMQLMAQMDIVVVPSRFEGFGLTAAEAMAMGKSVVVSNVFGLKELITHEEEGLVFENENAKDLAKQLSILLTSDDARTTYGRKAAQKALEQFDYSVFAKNIQCLYNLEI